MENYLNYALKREKNVTSELTSQVYRLKCRNCQTAEQKGELETSTSRKKNEGESVCLFLREFLSIRKSKGKALDYPKNTMGMAYEEPISMRVN